MISLFVYKDEEYGERLPILTPLPKAHTNERTGAYGVVVPTSRYAFLLEGKREKRRENPMRTVQSMLSTGIPCYFIFYTAKNRRNGRRRKIWGMKMCFTYTRECYDVHFVQ